MGGFELALFVDQPVRDDFVCQICQNAFSRPISVCCDGHTFCDDCVKEWKKQSNSCPQCRTQMLAVPVLNRLVQNFIMDLKVKCPESRSEPEPKRAKTDKEDHNADESSSSSSSSREVCCDWHGTLADYVDKHKVKECKYALVKCECRKMIRAYDLEEHKSNECPWRLVSCDLCDKPLRHFELADHVNKSCPNTIVKCTACGEQMERRVLGTRKFEQNSDGDWDDVYSGHMAVCPKLKIKCCFFRLGCDRVAREDMKQHHADCAEKHAQLVSAELKSLRSGKYWTGQSITWKIPTSRLRQLRQSRVKVMASQDVKTGDYRPYLRLKIDSTNRVVLHVCIRDYELRPRVDRLSFEIEPLVSNELEVEQRNAQVMKQDEEEEGVVYAGGTMKLSRYAEESDDEFDDYLGMTTMTVDDLIDNAPDDGNVLVMASFRLTGPERVFVREQRRRSTSSSDDH